MKTIPSKLGMEEENNLSFVLEKSLGKWSSEGPCSTSLIGQLPKCLQVSQPPTPAAQLYRLPGRVAYVDGGLGLGGHETHLLPVAQIRLPRGTGWAVVVCNVDS